MAFMALMTGNLNAQVFVTENNHNDMRVHADVAQSTEQQDRFTPLGSGTLILSVLGAAYLYGRKSRK